MSSKYWNAHCDPRVVNFWLMKNGPFRLVTFSAFYLFAIYLGRNLMRTRPAYRLRAAMFIYNLALILINANYLIKSLKWMDYGRELWNFDFPSPADQSPKTMQMVNEFYAYTMTKFIDYLDTAFFILRKKDAQVTALHVYHHVSVPIVGWICSWINPTMPILGLFATLNCSVHILMYGYYALSALGPALKPYLWWKRYLTQIQLIQFTIIGGYGVLLQMYHRNYPLVYRVVPISQSVLYLMMFGRFYIESYKKSSNRGICENAAEHKEENCKQIEHSNPNGNGNALPNGNNKRNKKAMKNE